MSNFYALLNRMKYIERWCLMRSTTSENLMEHCSQVAIIAHALALIKNKKFGGSIDADRVAVIALFHDASEVITGDMPTPIKYHNSKLKEAYKEIEELADDKLLSMLPDYLKEEYSKLFKVDKDSEEYKIVKAADKLSAYIKCIEETDCGNKEFSVAKLSTEKSLAETDMPEVDYFIKNFIKGFGEPLDVL